MYTLALEVNADIVYVFVYIIFTWSWTERLASFYDHIWLSKVDFSNNFDIYFLFFYITIKCVTNYLWIKGCEFVQFVQGQLSTQSRYDCACTCIVNFYVILDIIIFLFLHSMHEERNKIYTCIDWVRGNLRFVRPGIRYILVRNQTINIL